MGQVQNGCLYKRYMSSSQKTEAEEFKDFTNHFALIHSNAKSTPFVPLNITKLDKSKHENFDFVHFIIILFLHLLDLVLFTRNTNLYTYTGAAEGT